MNVEGRCHCGQIRYEAEVDPTAVKLCHCRDCQMLTGSAFRVIVPAPRETFELVSGVPSKYVKTADSGNKRVHAFCPGCGAPVYSCAISDPETYSLRVGCLEQRAQLVPQRQNWCVSALPWALDLSGVEQCERQ